MKQVNLILGLAMICLSLSAQKEKEVKLQEVTVNAARIIQKADGKLIIPSAAQQQASTNGYSLLAKLALPSIRVDEVMHTITALGNQGTVQIRLNGSIVSKSDLLSLDPKRIKNIDFIDNPGVRYGEGIAYVINIRTTYAQDGYVVGADLTCAVSACHGNDEVYARWNHNKSELGLTYNLSYTDFKGNQYTEEADYLLQDGSHYRIDRDDLRSRAHSISHNLELKYNLADSASYIFQTTLSTDLSRTPGDYHDRRLIDGTQEYLSSKCEHGHDFSPVLDIYFYHQLGLHQSVTANVVGTSIATNQYSYNNEGGDYAYWVNGHTWSILSEAIYENRLKPLTLSFGLQHKLKYTRNEYTGDVSSLNDMHNNSLYLFGEVKGTWSKLGYVAGLGVSNEHYRQGDHRFSFWLFRPKTTLTYAIFPSLRVRYSLEISQHISQIAMISDTKIRQNSMEWTVGNPDITPNKVIAHQLKFSYTLPRITSELYSEYRINPNCNMASYSRTADNQFYYTQKIQRGIKLFYIGNDTNWDVIPDVLSCSLSATLARFINQGDTYSHYLTSFNYSGSIQATLGKWSLYAYADNGWKFMEGETWNQQGAATYLTCTYHIGNCALSLYWQHPFLSHPKMNYAELVNEYIQKKITLYGKDFGNMVSVSFSWKFNQGRKYRDIQKKIKNEDKQTGIL